MTHDDLMDSLAGHLTAPNRMVWRRDYPDVNLAAVKGAT